MPFFTPFSTFAQASHFLIHELHKTNTKIYKDASGFDKSKQLLAALGNPQNTTPAVHIAATSGKGSIAYAINAILLAHGFHTTLIVSPHAYSIRERIQLNGNLISEADFVKYINILFTEWDKVGLTPSYFEAMMCLGFLAAAEQACDYLVVETGLGGLWDTSNTITRSDKLAVVGSIGLDHTHILGSTLEAIAAQKAGILPVDGVGIALKQTEAVNAVFMQTAQERHATLRWVTPTESAHDTNWLMAEEATQALAARDGWAYDDEKARAAIAALRIPGRLEVRHIGEQTFVLDAAHNPQKAAALTAWLSKTFPGVTFDVVLSISETKDASAVIQALNPITKRYIITEFLTDQQDLPVHAMSAAKLAKLVKTYGESRPLSVCETAQDAIAELHKAKQPYNLITGSFYLVGEVGPML